MFEIELTEEIRQAARKNAAEMIRSGSSIEELPLNTHSEAKLWITTEEAKNKILSLGSIEVENTLFFIGSKLNGVHS